MLFGAMGNEEVDQKFSIDMAAAAHRNRVRDSNSKMASSDDDYESSNKKSPQQLSTPEKPFEEIKIEPKKKNELPKAIHRQTNKYEIMD